MSLKRFLPQWMGGGVQLLVVRDAFKPEEIDTYCGANLDEVLNKAFSSKPANARIYQSGITSANDITHKDKGYLERVRGRVVCVCMPADPTGGLLTALVIGIAASAATLLLMPAMPEVSGGSDAAPSPTNSLASRENKPRLGKRIPDVLGGKLRVVPDLVAVPYSIYIDHQEVRYSYMCVSVGKCTVHAAYDDNTRTQEIAGMTVKAYEPDASRSADRRITEHAEQVRIGNAYSQQEQDYSGLEVKRYNSVNGQVLPPPDNFFESENNITFVHPNIVRISGNKKFTGQFSAGDTINITNANNLASAGNKTYDHDNNNSTSEVAVTYNLDGAYIIASLTDTEITLTNPHNVNADWSKLTTYVDSTVASSPVISTDSQTLWTQYFYCDDATAEGQMVNFYSANGLYTTDGNNHEPIAIQVEVEYERVDENQNPIAGTLNNGFFLLMSNGATLADIEASQATATLTSEIIKVITMRSTNDRTRRSAATTHKIPISGLCRWRMRRVTPTIQAKNRSVVQEITIKDFYSYKPLVQPALLNKCTTIYLKETATTAALARKKLKLELDVTRWVRDWQNNDVLKPSSRIDDIIYHCAREPHIGNQAASRLNMAQIHDETNAIISYFQQDAFAEFHGVFDQRNTSPQETLQAIAGAAFSKPYIFGNKIHLHFEKPEPASIVQFTSANMLPDSYTHSEKFGRVKKFDGVEVAYKDERNKPQMFRYPASGVTNPHKLELMGVQDVNVIKAHAMRAYKKDELAYKQVEFTGADETAVVIPSNRVGVANITRADIQEGYVDGLDVIKNKIVISTSQPVKLDSGRAYTLFVQQTNATVDNIPVTAQYNSNQLVLSRLPSHAISFGAEVVVNATYQLVSNDDLNRDTYLVTEKGKGNGLTHDITAINYHADYYKHDKDHLAT